MNNAPFFENVVSVPNSAAAASVHDLDVDGPAVPLGDAEVQATIYNPGAVAITVRFQNLETIAGAARFPQIDTVVVPAGGVISRIVRGWLWGEAPSRFQVSPDAAVAIAGGFNVTLRLRRI